MQVTEDRMRAERQQWAKELADLRESDARDIESWKRERERVLTLLLWKMRDEDSERLEVFREEMATDIFRNVLRKVESGEIACRKCAGIDEAHYPGHDEE